MVPWSPAGLIGPLFYLLPIWPHPPAVRHHSACTSYQTSYKHNKKQLIESTWKASCSFCRKARQTSKALDKLINNSLCTIKHSLASAKSANWSFHTRVVWFVSKGLFRGCCQISKQTKIPNYEMFQLRIAHNVTCQFKNLMYTSFWYEIGKWY